MSIISLLDTFCVGCSGLWPHLGHTRSCGTWIDCVGLGRIFSVLDTLVLSPSSALPRFFLLSVENESSFCHTQNGQISESPQTDCAPPSQLLSRVAWVDRQSRSQTAYPPPVVSWIVYPSAPWALGNPPYCRSPACLGIALPGCAPTDVATRLCKPEAWGDVHSAPMNWPISFNRFDRTGK